MEATAQKEFGGNLVDTVHLI